MSKTPWHESDNPTTVIRGGSWRAAIWITAVIAFVLVLGAALWALNVGASDVKGRGDAARMKNSAGNRVAAQERFEVLYREVRAADQRLDVLAADKRQAPGDETRTRYTGAVSYCFGVVRDYDAEARKFSAETFRAADLPDQIDPNDPNTDCKENS